MSSTSLKNSEAFNESCSIAPPRGDQNKVTSNMTESSGKPSPLLEEYTGDSGALDLSRGKSISPLNLDRKTQLFNETEPLDLTVEKGDVYDNTKISHLLGSKPVSTSPVFQRFSSTFTKAISNLFHAEFPYGLQSWNFHSYSAFLTAASAIYPYALRSWVFGSCTSQFNNLTNPPPTWHHLQKNSSEVEKINNCEKLMNPTRHHQSFQATGNTFSE